MGDLQHPTSYSVWPWRPASKDDILAGVWDVGFEGDPNIVEVYVRRLCTRIEESFGRRAIETVRGAGYRLAPDGG